LLLSMALISPRRFFFSFIRTAWFPSNRTLPPFRTQRKGSHRTIFFFFAVSFLCRPTHRFLPSHGCPTVFLPLAFYSRAPQFPPFSFVNNGLQTRQLGQVCPRDFLPSFLHIFVWAEPSASTLLRVGLFPEARIFVSPLYFLQVSLTRSDGYRFSLQ